MEKKVNWLSINLYDFDHGTGCWTGYSDAASPINQTPMNTIFDVACNGFLIVIKLLNVN